MTDYAIYMLDAGGHVASWNPGAQRAKGYTREEIIGQHFSRFYTEEDRAKRLACARARYRRHAKAASKDRRLAHAQGRHALVGARHHRSDPASDGQLIGFAKITRDLTDRQRCERRVAPERRALPHCWFRA